ncbi:hypothetical protein F0562_025414 [Nyssa sinensis]|uniref:Uncharacterized protein n=1 Tax=Nyssa sinensis TaxID=561372 RepID=A0A5J5BJW0_9ASTE|nr:hypothetical protein F0562_025414 [Nyssa sinensis]
MLDNPVNERSAMNSTKLGHHTETNRDERQPNREGVWCTYCKKARHTKDTCWKLHGKPPNVGGKGEPTVQPKNQDQPTHQPAVKQPLNQDQPTSKSSFDQPCDQPPELVLKSSLDQPHDQPLNQSESAPKIPLVAEKPILIYSRRKEPASIQLQVQDSTPEPGMQSQLPSPLTNDLDVPITVRKGVSKVYSTSYFSLSLWIESHINIVAFLLN